MRAAKRCALVLRCCVRALSGRTRVAFSRRSSCCRGGCWAVCRAQCGGGRALSGGCGCRASSRLRTRAERPAGCTGAPPRDISRMTVRPVVLAGVGFPRLHGGVARSRRIYDKFYICKSKNSFRGKPMLDCSGSRSEMCWSEMYGTPTPQACIKQCAGMRRCEGLAGAWTVGASRPAVCAV